MSVELKGMARFWFRFRFPEKKTVFRFLEKFFEGQRHTNYPCEMRFFPREKGKTAFFQRKTLFRKAIFPFSRGKNRISQGVENRGSLISVPLALRENGSDGSGFQFRLGSCATLPLANVQKILRSASRGVLTDFNGFEIS